jgi:hypothetical protein
VTNPLVEQRRAELAQAKREFWKLVGKAVFSSVAGAFAMHRILVKYLSPTTAIVVAILFGLLPAAIVAFLWGRSRRT